MRVRHSAETGGTSREEEVGLCGRPEAAYQSKKRARGRRGTGPPVAAGTGGFGSPQRHPSDLEELQDQIASGDGTAPRELARARSRPEPRDKVEGDPGWRPD